MRGKYSPTVTAAYVADQQWFINYCSHDINGSEYAEYDPEGYDGYGYNEAGKDRAGNHESDYYYNDAITLDDDYNHQYDAALDDWTFDGTKPVKR